MRAPRSARPLSLHVAESGLQPGICVTHACGFTLCIGLQPCPGGTAALRRRAANPRPSLPPPPSPSWSTLTIHAKPSAEPEGSAQRTAGPPWSGWGGCLILTSAEGGGENRRAEGALLHSAPPSSSSRPRFPFTAIQAPLPPDSLLLVLPFTLSLQPCQLLFLSFPSLSLSLQQNRS